MKENIKDGLKNKANTLFIIITLWTNEKKQNTYRNKSSAC